MTGPDSRERFTGLVDNYERYRPSYPPELIDWILDAAGLPTAAAVADIGCGTGISTRLLAERGLDVIGVDPNEAMLASARRLGGARYVRGEASSTGLPEVSVDLVTAAQAFHWFDLPAALAELRRILRPAGFCAAFWNLRGSSPFLDEYDRLLRALSSEYGVLLKPAETIAALQARPEVVGVREAEFACVQPLDRDGLFGRAYSSSYVVHGMADRAGFDRSLHELFDRHQRGGVVDFRYRSVVIGWRFG